MKFLTGTDEARRRASDALSKGAVRIRDRPVVEWSVAGNCTRPRPFTIEGKLWRDHATWNQHREAYWLDMQVRCRRCEACLKARAHHWAERGITEFHEAQRTWFGTLTFSPAEQWATEARARSNAAAWYRPVRRYGESESGFENRVKEARFSQMHFANGPLLTKWLKRIRKESGATLRYLMVAEAHKNGRPHYHVLIHESPGGGRVLHKTLSSQWVHGFAQFKLADDSAARYVCKYLSKSAEARIRASLNYGRLSVALNDSGVARGGGRSPRL